MADMNTTETPALNKASADAIEQLASVFSAYNDTTERMRYSYQRLQEDVVRLREELREKNEQLERKSRLAALGEMAAGMAHEIRNPLGGVQLYASLLERDLAEQDEPLQWVRKISKGVQALDRIVSDILAFTTEQMCVKEPVQVGAVLEEVLDLCRPRLADGTVCVHIDESAAGLTAAADAMMLQRILMNLLLNAIDAAGANEAGGHVWVRGKRYEEDGDIRVRLDVADNGSGIEPGVLVKIFNPFFTTKDTGTGLGLAIVHRLVECHGGVITAANGADGGAVFTVILPA
ncbi:MAG: hypothetical protein JW709_10965 [Sedimentisphaerales bacterium]|nr:hypothetical protein [Sedimentisphaerales bacterium]